MKVCFEVILVFSIIEIETHAFISGDSANVRNLQETKSTRILSPTDLNQLNSDGLFEETYSMETPYESRTSFNELFEKDYQIPLEQTIEKNYYPDDRSDSNSAYLASTEDHFNQPNNEDGYKPLIYEDSRSTETSYETLKATSTSSNPSNNANKPPTLPELPFGLPNGYSSNSQGSQTPTLIMGGFSILVMPMPGLTPGNMANLFQPGQQLGQASGTNPFLGPYPASG